MTSWTSEVQPMTLKGRIAVPYTWWVGETGSRFLVALRDEARIWGNRCDRCGTVYVPPRKNCGRCFVDIERWVELGREGTVTAHTVVRRAGAAAPLPPPFAYAIIRLDGADVGLLHLVAAPLAGLADGVRVRARFKAEEERRGRITDIESFEIVP